jgi:hypothetical protein
MTLINNIENLLLYQVAQWLEHGTHNAQVGSSNLLGRNFRVILMNIFILDEDLETSAQMLDDWHLEKAIKDISVTLCNVHPTLKYSTKWMKIPDKSIDDYNEWEKWAHQSIDNCKFLFDYARDLIGEHSYRFYIPCKCFMECAYLKPDGYWELEECEDHLPDFPYEAEEMDWIRTVPIISPDEHIIYQTKSFSDASAIPHVIDSYKNYYYFIVDQKLLENVSKISWTKRMSPAFISLWNKILNVGT